jgi:tripartite-type tricarboxylate transporter receptor subunit TctC
MPPIQRRQLLVAASATLLPASLYTQGAAAQGPAQAWPNKPVRIVVPFAAGGTTDILARALAPELGRVFGQTFVVDNKPGAGGNVAGAEVVRTPPDGANLLITSSSAAVSKLLYKTMAYDPFTDLAPVTMAVSIPNVMVVPAASPDKSIADFIARAKANPGKLNFGSAGIGSSIHLSGELFKHLAKIDITHVPYRGAAPAMNDLIGNRLDVMFDTITVSTPHLRAGTTRALGVTSATPIPTLPDAPPIGTVVPGYVALSWFAFYAAAKTPGAILAKAAHDIEAALRHESVLARLTELGANVVGGSPASLAAAMVAEEKLWEPVIEAAGIKHSQ